MANMEGNAKIQWKEKFFYGMLLAGFSMRIPEREGFCRNDVQPRGGTGRSFAWPRG